MADLTEKVAVDAAIEKRKKIIKTVIIGSLILIVAYFGYKFLKNRI